MTNQTPGTAGSKIAVIINGIRLPHRSNRSSARLALMAAISGDHFQMLETADKADIEKVKNAIGAKLAQMYDTPAAIARSKMADEPALIEFGKLAARHDIAFDLKDETGWIWQTAETSRSTRLGGERAAVPSR